MVVGGLSGLPLAGAPGYCWECNQSVLLRSSPATIACSGPESAENPRISPRSLHAPIPSAPKTVSFPTDLSHFSSLSVSHPLQSNFTSTRCLFFWLQAWASPPESLPVPQSVPGHSLLQTHTGLAFSGLLCQGWGWRVGGLSPRIQGYGCTVHPEGSVGCSSS